MAGPARLVLGSSQVARSVVASARERPGKLVVVSDARRRVESLRDEGVDARRADPADVSAYPDHVTGVVVATPDAERNRDICEGVRERYPDAVVVCYAGDDPSPETVETMERVADRVLDSRTTLADRVVDVSTGPEADRVARLLRVLRSIEGRLAVVMHDNPDPDAIAAGLALARIAERVGLAADLCYFGEISHQENRAMVNLLELTLHRLERGADMSGYDGIALVDHSRPGVNDGLDPDTDVDVVVDHHPPREPVEARCLDLRSDVGATSTLLARYLDHLDVVPGTSLATALLFGIRVDTDDFSREVSTADFDAAASLLTHADHSVLDRVETPSMSPDVLETFARAIRNREIRGEALATNVGDLRDRDALAQAADRLLDMEDVHVTVVYGTMDDTIYVSARARGTTVDIGETLRNALGSIGSAGGHADMAGAQLSPGLLAAEADDEDLSMQERITQALNDRLFETLEAAPSTSIYDDAIGHEFSLGDAGR